MKYIDLEKLKRSIGSRLLCELADSHDVGEPDGEVLEQVNGESTSIIESYLSGRYAIPLQDSPLLMQITSDMMRLRLLMRRDQGTLSDTAKEVQKRLYKTLEELRDGALLLESDALGSASTGMPVGLNDVVVTDTQEAVRYVTTRPLFPKGFSTMR